MPTADAAPILQVRGLEVRYGSVPALRDVDLEVQRGEIVGLIGPNGAGKSTTLHAIVGTVRASAGEILLGGVSIRGRAPERIVRSGVGLVPEGRRIFAALTVEENLRLGLAGRRSKNGAHEALEMVNELFPVLRESRRRMRAFSPAASSSSWPSGAPSSPSRTCSSSTSLHSASPRRSSTPYSRSSERSVTEA